MREHQVAKYPQSLDAGPCPFRILIVDAHPVIRQVIRETLEESPGFAFCIEAADDPEARRLIADTPPHVALVDLSLGGSSGIDLVRWIKDNYPAVRILALSLYDASLYAPYAIAAGAHGYVNKGEAPDSMIHAIRHVMAGRIRTAPHPPG
jgi:DNA-binding NarL/FixJ family response regulator